MFVGDGQVWDGNNPPLSVTLPDYLSVKQIIELPADKEAFLLVSPDELGMVHDGAYSKILSRPGLCCAAVLPDGSVLVSSTRTLIHIHLGTGRILSEFASQICFKRMLALNDGAGVLGVSHSGELCLVNVSVRTVVGVMCPDVQCFATDGDRFVLVYGPELGYRMFDMADPTTILLSFNTVECCAGIVYHDFEFVVAIVDTNPETYRTGPSL